MNLGRKNTNYRGNKKMLNTNKKGYVKKLRTEKKEKDKMKLKGEILRRNIKNAKDSIKNNKEKLKKN